MRFITTAIFFVTFAAASAQLPAFEIYLGSLTDLSAKPINITNHTGYDNQPSFSPDGKYILYSSFHDTIQSDIYKYEIAKGKTTQLTKTTESEYSPEVTPDKKHISVVRVETDSSQRLCFYDLKGENPELKLDSFKLIGYYGWLSEDYIAMFNLPEPFTLTLANMQQTDIWNADENIGRCIKKMNENSLSYIVKVNDSVWEIKKLLIMDIKQGEELARKKNERSNQTITSISNISEDYAWSPDGSRVYMARGAQLWYYEYAGDQQWHMLTDYSAFGIKKIYRLAISPNGENIVFVAEE